MQLTRSINVRPDHATITNLWNGERGKKLKVKLLRIALEQDLGVVATYIMQKQLANPLVGHVRQDSGTHSLIRWNWWLGWLTTWSNIHATSVHSPLNWKGAGKYDGISGNRSIKGVVAMLFYTQVGSKSASWSRTRMLYDHWLDPMGTTSPMADMP